MVQQFCYYLRVRYAECDPQQVVFNTRYNEYVVVGISEFMRAIGLRSEFSSDRLGFQWVSQTIQWYSSARFDQVLELTLHTTKVGSTSFTIATEIRGADGDQRRIATVETVLVLIDMGSMSKTPLSERHRALLLNGAPGAVMDHAGFLSPQGNRLP